MYTVDDKDQVIEISEIPSPELGASCPYLTATDNSLTLAYHTCGPLDPKTGRVVSPVDYTAFVRVPSPFAHYFGPPNEEALGGHPLAKRGLEMGSVHEVIQSSWIRSLERMNEVHPGHAKVVSHYRSMRHIIVTFQDSTFECVFSGTLNHVIRAGTPQPAL